MRLLVEGVLISRTKTGWIGRWGLASPALCLHRPSAPSMQLPPHRACALTRTHRAPLQRHIGSNAAWARPPTLTTEVGKATETPKLLSYSSFKDRLSIDKRTVRPLRTEALATDCQACRTFRSCRFSRLQRFAPHRPVWACCIPLPTMRSTWFRAGRRLLPTTPPSSQVPTLRSLSLLTKWNPSPPARLARRPHPVKFTEVPAPLDGSLPVPSYPRRSDGRLTTGRHPQGCDPAKSPLSDRRVATTDRPDAPLGFHSTSGSRLAAATALQDRSPKTTTLGPTAQPPPK
jgi:hypothetical protein